MRLSMEAISIHHVGLPTSNWANETREIFRVVLQVGILNDDYIAGHMRKRGSNRCAFPTVPFMKYYAHIWHLTKNIQSISRSVDRRIVHNDDLFRKPHIHSLNFADHLGNGGCFIIRRHDD